VTDSAAIHAISRSFTLFGTAPCDACGNWLSRVTIYEHEGGAHFRGFVLTRSILARARIAALAAACAVVLAGCNYETASLMGLEPKHMKPLSSELVSLIEQKGMTKQSPILIRIFKEEAEVEVWKQTAAGDYDC
jgi:hypothetical protein